MIPTSNEQDAIRIQRDPSRVCYERAGERIVGDGANAMRIGTAHSARSDQEDLVLQLDALRIGPTGREAPADPFAARLERKFARQNRYKRHEL